MSSRHLIAAALAALLPFSLVACNGDNSSDTAKSVAKKASDKKASTESGDSSTSSDGTVETTVSVPKQKFDEAIGSLNKDLSASKDDICKLFGLFDSTAQVEDPADAAQTEQAITYVASLIRAIADQSPADAAALNTAADSLVSEAKAADYSPDVLQKGLKAFEDPAFNTAMTNFQTTAEKKCGAPTTEAGN